MIAYYKGELYNWVALGRVNYIVTYKPEKADETFIEKNGYFKKEVRKDDENLTAIRKMHFYVEYDDEVEPYKEWLVDEGMPLYELPHIENDEVGLCVGHGSKGYEWVQFDKCLAGKIVKLSECKGFIVETEHKYEAGRCVERSQRERVHVDADEFKRLMLMYRRKNI